MTDAADQVKELRARADDAFTAFAGFHAMYKEALDYAIPNRSPALDAGVERQEREIYDITGTISTVTGAAQLRADLFPVNFFTLAPGAIAKMAMKPEEVQEASSTLAGLGATLHSLIRTPKFLNAADTMCVDLYNGTAALAILQGDMSAPFRWLVIPMAQCAPVVDAYGELRELHWKVQMARADVEREWPKAPFSTEFRDATKAQPRQKVRVYQSWTMIERGPGWQLQIAVDGVDGIVDEQAYECQPVAVARYWLRPGDAGGRGPLQMAMPAMIVANLVQELTLRFGSIQLGGIWGYRPLDFNPSQVSFKPGAWWPMASTGGVMGPAVQRLDNPNGRLDFSQLVLGELRDQIRAALQDDSLAGQGLTPKSAAEVVARLEKIALKAQAGHMRVIAELYPVIVKRCISILKGLGLPFQVPHIDDVLVQVEVTTPISAASQMHLVRAIVEFLTILREVAPTELDVHVRSDEAIRRIAEGMLVPADLLPTNAEKRQTRKRKTEAQFALMAAQSAAQGAAPGGQTP